MLNNIPERIKKLFLLNFTEEILRNYKSIYLYKLKEKIVEEENKKFIPVILKKTKLITKKEIIEKIKEKASQKLKKNLIQELKSPINPLITKEIVMRHPSRMAPLLGRQIITIEKPLHQRVLRIPEPRLPERLQHLKPSPTYAEINLGKLIPLINDTDVDSIECLGTNQKIFVEGKMGKKPTAIVLTKEEINNIISEFSMKSKIPIGDGISKVAVGKLTFTSIKTESEVQFIIKKMKMAPFRGIPTPTY